MNTDFWQYFKNDQGRFRAKKLPSGKRATVWFKDITDLADIREYLRDARSFKEGIEEYKQYFDEPYSYEVEVESFETVVEKNRNKFLGRFPEFKKQISLLYDLTEIQGETSEWLFIDPKLGAKMVEEGLLERIPMTPELWNEYLTNEVRVTDLKALVGDAVKLKGKKAEQVDQICDAIQSKKISIPEPFAVRPGESFEDWISGLQLKYVDELQSALKSWPYPEHFQSAVWDAVLDENMDWEVLCKTVAERFQRSPHLDQPESFKPLIKADFDVTPTLPQKKGGGCFISSILSVVVLIATAGYLFS